ncbi:DsbA family oxidoreductase [Clavibacter phaseoli]|uniref:DsbA family oxidoreductase n=1 Tax=Clavibacter phaseoli TaxID=1734031 RepID=UPI000E667567|nr:DsbA family oxidoreductase [Clavibacter phaseoli]RIJ58687.1 DsbA family oxidoreductase [Clavibacter phaseoli]UKF30619.1 DsbA family oxidoreductase [Clavibacter phaseoli]UKF36537.1 DsbA family oxidoreductase [Clavibacter phaseoli]
MTDSSAPALPAIRVDVWSDIACPWCYVGKRRFEAGARAFAERTPGAPEIAITYRSFELAPDTPVDFQGTEVDFLAGHKGIPADRVATMLDDMTRLAAAEGLAYDYDALQHTNTVLAHELLHLARVRGVQLEMVERLLKAYFTEGRHVGRVPDLVELAVEVGLDADEAREALETHRHLDDVRADQAQAMAYGIQGVPFFVIDERFGISGAQDPTVFASALGEALAARDGDTVRVVAGEEAAR